MVLCLVLAPAGARAQASAADTVIVGLAEAEARALEQSPLLGPALASVEIARAQQSRAEHARFLPELKLRNVWGPIPRARGEFNEFGVLMSPDTMTGLDDLTWFTQVDLNFVQPLYTFGKLGATLDAARHQVEAVRADVQKTRAEVLLQVRQLYWGALLSEELLGVSRSVNDRVAEAEQRLQELYDEGDASQNDLFKFEIFKYQVRSQTREVESGRTKALAALKAMVGVPDSVPIRLADASLDALQVELDSLSAYVREALASRPELQQLEAGIAARRALVRAAEAASRPTLFLAGQLSINESPGRFDPRNPFVNNPTNFTRPGLVVGFDWNLNFRDNRDKAAVERFEAEKLEAQARPLRLMIEQQVREAYLDVERARIDVEEGRDALRASENLLRAELQTFDIGLGSIDDVIDAFQSNVTMAVEQLRNIAELNTKLAELSRRVGRDIAARSTR